MNAQPDRQEGWLPGNTQIFDRRRQPTLPRRWLVAGFGGAVALAGGAGWVVRTSSLPKEPDCGRDDYQPPSREVGAGRLDLVQVLRGRRMIVGNYVRGLDLGINRDNLLHLICNPKVGIGLDRAEYLNQFLFAYLWPVYVADATPAQLDHFRDQESFRLLGAHFQVDRERPPQFHMNHYLVPFYTEINVVTGIISPEADPARFRVELGQRLSEYLLDGVKDTVHGPGELSAEAIELIRKRPPFVVNRIDPAIIYLANTLPPRLPLPPFP